VVERLAAHWDLLLLLPLLLLHPVAMAPAALPAALVELVAAVAALAAAQGACAGCGQQGWQQDPRGRLRLRMEARGTASCHYAV
jgi:hypothetical protein